MQFDETTKSRLIADLGNYYFFWMRSIPVCPFFLPCIFCLLPYYLQKKKERMQAVIGVRRCGTSACHIYTTLYLSIITLFELL